MATFAGGQTYDPGSSGKIKLPNVPEAQMAEPLPINYPNYAFFGQTPSGAPDPFDYFRISNEMRKQNMAFYPLQVQQQLAMMPQITAAQMAASQQAFPLQLQQQQQASQQAFEEQMRQYGIAAPQIAGTNWALANQYGPSYANLYGSMLRQEAARGAAQMNEMSRTYDPEFYSTYSALGGRIGEGLKAGYELGTDLEREVQQGIRASQTARGNYLGPAPTAEEAFGKGQAALNLYNQRIGQAQNFLQGRAPTDLWASLGPAYTAGSTAAGMGVTMPPQTAAPQVGLMSGMVQPTAGMAAQAAGGFLQNPGTDWMAQAPSTYNTYMGSLGQWGGQQIQGQLGYNANLINAAEVNNAGQFAMYDKQFEQFLFDQGVAQGLYSQPSAAGGSGVAGAAIGGVASVAAAGIAAF